MTIILLLLSIIMYISDMQDKSQMWHLRKVCSTPQRVMAQSMENYCFKASQTLQITHKVLLVLCASVPQRKDKLFEENNQVLKFLHIFWV